MSNISDHTLLSVYLWTKVRTEFRSIFIIYNSNSRTFLHTNTDITTYKIIIKYISWLHSNWTSFKHKMEMDGEPCNDVVGTGSVFSLEQITWLVSLEWGRLLTNMLLNGNKNLIFDCRITNILKHTGHGQNWPVEVTRGLSKD